MGLITVVITPQTNMIILTCNYNVCHYLVITQVCCGLSILCLVVVAVSIGYKSETHYRLEEPSR